ncbi:MAG: apolipoprotein N-acyltransferase [Parachlamydiales bacterium]|nr:apolipoprotein N-acyltransferase [Parachlamydiales bacterium]
MWYFALSFLLTAFGQPAWISGFGTLAAVFGYAIFWKGVLNVPRPMHRFIYATLWFAAVQGVQLSWLATPDYMGVLIIPFYMFLILGMGLQFGFISHFVTQPLSWLKLLAISGAWVICEWLRLFFLCGYTWNPTGLALTDTSYSLQFASVWGIFGLSFWVILVNLAVLKAWIEKSIRKTMIGVGLAVFPYLFGALQLAWVESSIPVSNTLKVALVQTNLAPEEKEFDSKLPTAYIHPLDQWEAILAALKEEKQADLIVLPEAALPLGAHTANYDLESIKKIFPEESLPPLKRPYAIFYRGSWRITNAYLAQALANQYKAHVIIGLDDRDMDGKYNAAFHFHPMDLIPKRYEKQILAPIGEYIPLGNWPRFARFIGEQYGIHSSFDPGKEGKIFQAQVPIGISICLEETFTSIMRQLRLKGAELFVSVSNDAYFPRTKLGWQHFHHGRVRAVENGAALLRSCNSGVTAGVDCFGRPFKILNSEKHTNALYFTFPVRSFKTLYTFWGDAAILTQSSLLIGAYLFFSRKKKLP